MESKDVIEEIIRRLKLNSHPHLTYIAKEYSVKDLIKELESLLENK